MPDSVSVFQTPSNCNKNKNVHNPHVQNENAIIPNLVYSVTLIDSLVISETYKRNSSFFLAQRVPEKIKNSSCGAVINGSFRSN